ncbi:hypothetical protein IJI18_01360, partial [Candidatus Saccharibacteria bacterium]|nr:hypothetical protein [Candidatus Saccharibacteria bacterium]
MIQNLRLGQSATSMSLNSSNSNTTSNGFTLNGKISDGKFPYSKINNIDYQSETSHYYCTNNYGCYYNWYTATAGSGTASVTTDGTSVNYDICPSHWILPTGGTNGGQFRTLAVAYGYGVDTSATVAKAMLVNPTSATENTNGEFAPGFLLSGSYLNSTSYTNVGVYWSRTAAATADASGYGYRMDIYSSTIDFSRGWKYEGYAVRCLAK